MGGVYAYLLGMYLGDGMLSLGRRHVWRLRITLDAKYPGIVARTSSSIVGLRARPPGIVPRDGAVEVYSYWKHWICLFPQHGRGPKHLRPMSLTPWQLDLVHWYPEEFLTGLVHSDGCRCQNRVGTYSYPRYFFSNQSSEIRTLFLMACGLVGVRARHANTWNLSVARRDDVELLDTFIGPKR